jgi:HPt (histidine-containing phosphotransfer) domain-containing protein
VDELLVEFLTESAENLAALDIELVKLEQEPNTPGLLANIFRLVHTIKGTSGFFGLPRLETLAHAAEDVLGRLLPEPPVPASLDWGPCWFLALPLRWSRSVHAEHRREGSSMNLYRRLETPQQ